jgi:hypothetical protein
LSDFSFINPAKNSSRVISLISLLVLRFATVFAHIPSSRNRPDGTETVILWSPSSSGAESIDQENYVAIMANIGLVSSWLNVQGLDIAELEEHTVLLIPDRPSMSDINMEPIHPLAQPGFASTQAVGTEFLQQLQIASEGHGRVCSLIAEPPSEGLRSRIVRPIGVSFR